MIVAGGPRSGKTTLASMLGEHPLPRSMNMSDDLRALEWSESSRVASEWFDAEGRWICEGVVMPRAMRKWLARTPDAPPADLVIWTNSEATHRVRGQHVMAKGCETVFNEIRPELERRGTRILEI